jgi:hypothetical protein
MSVQLDGVKETLRALRKIDPELLKEMNKEIKGIMIPIRDKAREYAPTAAPLYNWDEQSYATRVKKPRETATRKFPLYQAEAARKGIYYSQSPSKRNAKGWSSQYIIANASASGAIYETAGRKNPSGSSRSKSNNPGAGSNFISRMGPLYGQDQASRGRMIFRAWYENQGRAQAAVVQAIVNTIAAFNQGRYDKAA